MVGINKKVRKRRILMKLTQADLAEKAGVSRQTIIEVENGRSVRDTTKYLVADALGCEVEDLFPENIELQGGVV